MREKQQNSFLVVWLMSNEVFQQQLADPLVRTMAGSKEKLQTDTFQAPTFHLHGAHPLISAAHSECYLF